IPPWVRTRVLDPETMRDVPEGKSGVLVHYDLANLEIPLAIQTEDVGSVAAGRLRLEGRLPEAERRGCSLPFERFVERERP
ncbi:MAG TPA: long-chain fatty acid--CoA ligase, partial [Candidatus Dormibacteraeota bacterium]|nr:long-chain fatty acid--CoA ligase [Candidatus Dormibacteraeota bacterium]